MAKKPLEMAGTLTGRKTLSRGVDKVRLVALAVVSTKSSFLTLELGEMLPRFDLHMVFFSDGFFSHPRFVDDSPVPFP